MEEQDWKCNTSHITMQIILEILEVYRTRYVYQTRAVANHAVALPAVAVVSKYGNSTGECTST